MERRTTSNVLVNHSHKTLHFTFTIDMAWTVIFFLATTSKSMGTKDEFPGIGNKRLVREAKTHVHLVKVLECLELYLRSPYTPTWRGSKAQGENLPYLISNTHTRVLNKLQCEIKPWGTILVVVSSFSSSFIFSTHNKINDQFHRAQSFLRSQKSLSLSRNSLPFI
jgi:hypothetical protein